MNDTKNLEQLKERIEKLEKWHQIEILKILMDNETKLNENKSGVFVNMTFLDEKIIEQINKYLNYILDQENNLTNTESKKQEFRATYFNLKEDKDSALYNNNYGSTL